MDNGDNLTKRIEAVEKAVFVWLTEKRIDAARRLHDWRRSEVEKAHRMINHAARISQALSRVDEHLKKKWETNAEEENAIRAEAKELKQLRFQMLWMLLLDCSFK